MLQSSTEEYWKLRRDIHFTDFHMDEDSLFDGLNCLGPPFQVNMAKITHNKILAVRTNLRTIYGGNLGLTPKIAPERLIAHTFNHWMILNMDFQPFLPAKLGWPGLILQLDNKHRELCPEGGTEFRVVIKHEPWFLEYVGQYKMVRLKNITTDQWKQQPPEVITPMHT